MDPKHRSHLITDGRDRAGARAMFKAIGFSGEDIRKPLIGVANTWIETMPCNFHLRRLSEKVKQGIRAAGGTPMEFNTIAISDGETMGTEGMRASLVSREVIADSIELVCRGQLFDAVVCVVGCDKTIPAAAMALARLDLPGVVLYGGTIAAGSYRGKDVTIQDVFEAIGANAAGKISDTDLQELEDVACPGAGACGGQYTANTMSTVMEMIGLSPMGFNSVPAIDPRKDEIAQDCGKLVMDVLKRGVKARDILTRHAFEELKVRRLETKHVLKHAARGLVPDRIIDKPKVGFFNAAVEGWFRAQTRGAISDYLLGPSPRYGDMLDRGEVERLVRRHAEGSETSSYVLLSILMLEVWLATYLPAAVPARSADEPAALGIGA